MYVIYRVTQAESVIHILMAASQEYVIAYSTCRVGTSGVPEGGQGNPKLRLCQARCRVGSEHET